VSEPQLKCCLDRCNNNAWTGISDYCQFHRLEQEEESCENCHLSPIDCKGHTLKSACIELSTLHAQLSRYEQGINLHLSKKQLIDLSDILLMTTDEGPADSGWAREKLMELRCIVDKALKVLVP
jgi:hypothetical protein